MHRALLGYAGKTIYFLNLEFKFLLFTLTLHSNDNFVNYWGLALRSGFAFEPLG